MDFELISGITAIEPIAVGRGIRDRRLITKGVWEGPLAKVARHRDRPSARWYDSYSRDPLELKLKLPLLD